MIFGQLVKAWREAHKRSLRDLAKTIGVTHSALYRFECGREIESRQWVKIAKWALTAEA